VIPILLALLATQDVTPPETFFGHRMGADRKIAPYPRIVEYLKLLDRQSDRLLLEIPGRSTLGLPFAMAVITHPDNALDLKGYAVGSKTLFEGRVGEGEARRLAKAGKAIVLFTCNIHSTEIASSQTAAELAYELVKGRVDLKDVIVLLMPSINPDGQVMIQEWYDKYVGTEFEGGPMPKLYHAYAGHDNNRDGYMLSLVETRHVAKVHYQDWFPQIDVDHHQMGATGARMWVPPYAEPLNANVHPLIHRWLNVFGTHMALDLERSGRTGVQSRRMFEAYWPGATDSTPWWHNRIGILTESASCRIATPLTVDPSEALKEQGVLHPNPWKGGTWRLRDIVDQQLTASCSIVETAARHKEEILLHTWRMAREQIERGKAESRAAWVLPKEQRDPSALRRLAEVLEAVGVELYEAEGKVVIPLAQPSRAYVRNLFERQVYPLKEKPYDVAGWTIQLQMGLEARESRESARLSAAPVSFAAPAVKPLLSRYVAAAAGDTSLSRATNELLKDGKAVYRLAEASDGLEAGSIVVAAANQASLPEAQQPVPGNPDVYVLKPVRLGLYQPWRASMDEGWTRLVLEQFKFPYASIHNPRMKKGELGKDFDAIILPDMSAEFIRDGRSKEDKEKPQVFPLEYQGGIGKEGVEALKKFVEGGGTLICLSAACNLPIEDWGPPVRNALKDDKDFSCPGSLLKVKVDTSHPLGFGMPEEAYVYTTNSPALQTSVPTRVDIDRRVVARYDDRENPLASGYLNQPDKLLGRSALVEVTWGKGRIVLFGFRPQHRAQTYGTFRMLFNAIRLATAEKGKLP
jgi:hypothetical protein